MWDKDKGLQMILPCWRGRKLPVAEISAHGGGEGERSGSDCEITCVVKVGSYLQLFLTLPEKKWTLGPFTTAPNNCQIVSQ